MLVGAGRGNSGKEKGNMRCIDQTGKLKRDFQTELKKSHLSSNDCSS